MKREPWVRFGMRISPKINENPADNRNNRPPNVMLLTASNSQKVMLGVFARCARLRNRSAACAAPPSALQWRKVARIDRLREELLLIIGPKLAYVLIGFDRLIDEFAARFLAAADIEITDDVAEMIELDRSARRVGERDRFERRHQSFLVV